MSRAGSTTSLPTAHKRPSEDTNEKVPHTRTENVTAETSDASHANVLWVDWDGPGDPMNPKKWVVRLLFVQLTLTYDNVF